MTVEPPYSLVDRIDDPFVRCSFRTVHGWALALGAFYDESLLTARLLLRDATEHRLEPVLPYGFATEAMALAGLRRFDEALAAAELSGHESRRLHDASGSVNAYAMRIRILLQAGEVAEACATEPPDVEGVQPSIAGESMARERSHSPPWLALTRPSLSPRLLLQKRVG